MVSACAIIMAMVSAWAIIMATIMISQEMCIIMLRKAMKRTAGISPSPQLSLQVVARKALSSHLDTSCSDFVREGSSESFLSLLA